MIKVTFKDMTSIDNDFPMTAREILVKTNFPKRESTVACRVNRIQRPLSWMISMDSSLEFITTDSVEGLEVYNRTLAFILTSAATRICGIRLRLSQSMHYSYYYESPDGEITPSQYNEIYDEMKRMVKEGVPLVREELSMDRARAVMISQGYSDKEQLLRWADNDPVILYKCEGIYDFFGGALSDTASAIQTFELSLYSGGLFLSGPTLSDSRKVIPLQTSAKTFKLFADYAKWLDNLSLGTMDRIHKIVAEGHSRDLIMLCEALHTKILSKVADNIESRPQVRLLCLAGPSSSGKTTSSRRLRVQLLTSGINSATIELDNYFVNRESTPKDLDGKYDFEALEALDTDLINEHLADLVEGKEVDVPKFDFVSGVRTKGYKLKLDPGQLLVIEGIHGLNEIISESIPSENKYGIFICPLTGTNLDLHNRVGTTDIRLLRRIIRDYKTRGNSPEKTLTQWPSVIRGSLRHIFPYQENADTLFNTSLAYELPVLKGYVLPLLKGIDEDSPVFGEAQRLLSILDFVPVIPSDDVPNLSIIREFIGGSCFA